ncbi:HDOD domain-containing protein [Sulfuriferula thiophila]|uniref:HDOD domain-containing protein n=1 Tax=Sulfuriferula thiophila TaxID=1781211 RepID=UPI001673434A|nr:HDOD domain-containing protein [Sulfuriferula thiophila]
MGDKTKMVTAVSLDEALAKLHQLPVIPVVVQEVISSFNDPDLDSVLLAHKIEQDQGLTAKILRVVNSAFYGLSRRVSSIHEAVVVMGFNSVRSLVLSTGFVKAFAVAEASEFDRHAYWRRSFRVAAYAKALAKCLRHDQDMAFTAGMFHDIGLLVLDTCMQAQFAGVLTQQNQSGENLLTLERSVLGFDHAQIGAEVAKRWNFPPSIEHAIRYCHTPEHVPFEPVTGIVYVAALIESGITGETLISQLPGSLRDHLHLTWESIEAGLPDAEQIDASAELLLTS